MTLELHYDSECEKITTFKIAETVIDLCEFHGLSAEVVAKMILLAIGSKEVKK